MMLTILDAAVAASLKNDMTSGMLMLPNYLDMSIRY